MAELAKARLQRVKADETAEPIGDPIVVQFNPTSLRLSLSAVTDGAGTVGRPRTQYLGTASAVLSVELVFDTADEGTTDEAKSVLDLTTPVEQLLLPQGSAEDKQQPPKVRFEWGTFLLTGVVESMSLDLDLFSEGGVPLRGKINLTIREQDSDLEFMKRGPGANKAGNALLPGRAGPGAVGGIGLGAGVSLGLNASAGLSVGLGVGASFSAGVSGSAQAGLAIGGESAAEFAARVGVDPAAWRAIATGQVDATLSLEAGAEIEFTAGLSAGAGMGASVGAQAGVADSLERSFGLAAPSAAGATASLAAPGFALSAAGGVAAALETVAVVRSESAAHKARQAFDAPAAPAGTPSAAQGPTVRSGISSLPAATVDAARREDIVSPPRPDRPSQPRTPLALTGSTLPSRRPAPPAPPPPQADPRAVSFGLGVPLRPRLGGAAEERQGGLGGLIPLRPRPRQSDLAEADDPTRPPWTALRPAAPVPGGAGRRRPRQAPCACGCACGCGADPAHSLSLPLRGEGWGGGSKNKRH